MATATSTTKAILPLHHHHHHPPTAATKNGLPISIRAYKDFILEFHQNQKPSNRAIKLAESLSNMLYQQIERNLNHRTSNVPRIEDKHDTPTMSPKEDISKKWQEIHGSNDWNNLLDPLHPWLRREIVKYGEFAQATYDAFDFDSFSEYCGSCRYNQQKLFEKLGLTKSGYEVTKYIYAMSQIDLPQWLERSRFVDTWSKDSNWIGFVAVSDDEETRRIGRRDIAVAWRGTVAPSEWYDNMQRKLEPIGQGEAKVEYGFLSIYSSKSESTRYNKSSASEQVMREVMKLVNYYNGRGEEVSLTITGHSLGGALGLLNAYEAAKNFPGLPISVISFAAPRVGNIAFRDELYQMGVKTLRVTIKQDVVPRMPGIVFNESLQKFDDFTGTLEWVYTHVGVELKLDIRSSPYLKKGMNLVGIHMLETYLHLVDGFLDSTTTFRSDAKRDVVLVNKECDMLVDELRIPHNWYQLENKGLERNFHGRWVKPTRDPEDIPSPIVESYNNVLEMQDS
ncbi:phospholipase A1-Igamma1, chloroplastic [Olea europaea var. sylvestris]|uniref:Phospholipase A1-Igamma1, chloroplastic n=1 Tax=Olea europaea subsp. europaea TaxID=158383 RepID=A0A8S0V4T9_OLEEU|nr:phospholipase A1-Igamma1, chloroplastic [Olea europaea var. sylvestris]CAA3025784.1 phospholipase A1-Igamma1, chloroplastic [Olea europaea subsp. europaea]